MPGSIAHDAFPEHPRLIPEGSEWCIVKPSWHTTRAQPLPSGVPWVAKPVTSSQLVILIILACGETLAKLQASTP